MDLDVFLTTRLGDSLPSARAGEGDRAGEGEGSCESASIRSSDALSCDLVISRSLRIALTWALESCPTLSCRRRNRLLDKPSAARFVSSSS